MKPRGPNLLDIRHAIALAAVFALDWASDLLKLPRPSDSGVDGLLSANLKYKPEHESPTARMFATDPARGLSLSR